MHEQADVIVRQDISNNTASGVGYGCRAVHCERGVCQVDADTYQYILYIKL